jgi:aminoglycoside phosphotransferase family enzyme/predicted kinase
VLAPELTHLADLLEREAYSHPVDEVQVVTTHISQLFLAGDFAYKLKRPVSLGFVDFSTLGRRRFFCEEELRLNRRLAPQLYLGVVAVVRRDGRLQMDGEIGGDGEVVDYAVRMRRFPQQALLSDQPVDGGRLNGTLIDRLAERVAAFHGALTPAPAESPYGEPAQVLAPMLHNFEPLRAALTADGESGGPALMQLERLERWTRKRFTYLGPLLERRRREGHIRECHGDMHRGNIAVLDQEPVIFDCLEFNPNLRWIDTMSEVAFLTMDLAQSGAAGLARRLLNRYLEVSGDYAGLRLLRFYQVYRALVRGKVNAIRLLELRGASQAPAPTVPEPSAEQADLDQALGQASAAMHHYLALARTCTGRHRPQLFVTYGLSGSGKTWLGHLLREHLPIIQIRSDVERKRLFGVPEQRRASEHPDPQLYGDEATERTYGRLLGLARELIEAGFSVLVDATFLSRRQRDPFLALAADLDCPCRILALQAPMHLLRERLRQRTLEAKDASDADIDVLSLQIARREPLGEDEHRHAVFLNTAAPMQIESVLARVTEPSPRRAAASALRRQGR